MAKPGRKGERLVGLFLLGCLLFNFPLLALFNVRGTVFGMPAALRVPLRRLGAADRAGGGDHGTRGLRGAACSRAGSSSSRRSATSGCCSRSPTTPTSAPIAGRSVIANPVIYSLSLAVYATAWTFYGSVGRAASDGVGFLPIYIGPTLMILLWWFVVRKMIRISKVNRITSLADFIASRYGKSALLGGLVTVIAVIGILPYISLQLKAVSVELPDPAAVPRDRDAAEGRARSTILQDTAFYVALFMALFTIAFGTRAARRERAPRGHGRGDRLRVDREAGRLPRGGRVRDLRDLQRRRATSSAAPRSVPTSRS